MTQIRRALLAVSAAAALAGTGLTLATEASAAAPPASWKCEKQHANTTYQVYCLKMPAGHKVQVVLNCKIFATGKNATYLGPAVNNVVISDVSSKDCLARDGYVTSYGPRAL